jgi:hypothetical protein
VLKNTLLQPGHILETIQASILRESSVQVKEVYYPLNNGFYDIRCGKIDLKLGEEKFGLYDIEVIPKYSKEEFGKVFGKQTDRFDVLIDKFEVIGLDLAKLLLENKIELAKIVVTGADINIYRDKNITFDTTNFPLLPHQALGRVTEYINVGKVEVIKSKLLYEELVPGAKVVGKVPITEMYATIYNITNSAEVIAKNGPMKWDAQGNLFDKALLTLEVDFPKDLSESSFTFSGGLAEMDMTAFNIYTKPNLKVEINEGKINGLTFSVDAGEIYSTGTMTMLYKGIKIKVLKEFTEESEKKMGFVSSLANMVIKSNNPPKKGDKPAASAEIFFVQDKNKAIINYMVKSLINGMEGSLVPAAGMTKEKYEKRKVKEVKKEGHQQKKRCTPAEKG